VATHLSQFRAVTPALVEQRRAERFPVSVTRAVVRKPGSAPVEATLHDLSIYGCRFETRVEFAADEALTLRLDGRDAVEAAVVWCKDGFVGCRFATPISRGLVRDLTLTIR
jgi:hypothetical protein